MEKWYSKFRRGDVWFLHFNSECGDGKAASSVEKKSRPYLIVSCEENNMNAPTINVVLITTRNNDHLPMHVFFVYQDGTPNGRNQMVLCEQITTVSELVFNHPQSHFMYSFDLIFMNKIDEALTRQLGLKPRVADMKIIERLIDELASKKEAELKRAKEAEVQKRVEDIVAQLSQRFGLNLSSDVLQNDQEYRPEELQMADKADVKKMRDTAARRKSKAEVEPVLRAKVESQQTFLDSVTAEVGISKQDVLGEMYHLKPGEHIEEIKAAAKKVDEAQKQPKHQKGTSWTDDQKREFVADYASLSISAVSAKWGLTKKSIQQTVWKFKKELGVGDTK